ncbi:MAG: putative 19 [Polyangiaceae bacterium]|jgi:Raf kinase inhibitor-like YbhB/YbcL family protein|nr:putative 19 [Polyangiaceae bacterium]
MSARKFSTFALFASGALLLTNCSDDSAAPGPGTAGTGGSANAGGSANGGGGAASAGTGPGGGGASVGGSNASGSNAGGGGSGTSGAGGSAAGTGGANGGTGGAVGGTSGSGGGGGSGGGSAFTLTSTDLMNGGNFLDKNTCNGKAFGDDESPALAWTEPPAGTKSFALTFIDVTLTASNPSNPMGHHWMAYNIPAATRALPGDLPDGTTLTTPVALKQVPQSYLGPCPAGMMHTYELTLYALDVETIDPGGGNALSKAMVDKIKAASVGSAVLSGKSSAQSQ